VLGSHLLCAAATKHAGLLLWQLAWQFFCVSNPLATPAVDDGLVISASSSTLSAVPAV
jgi:hypothetical protein